MSDPRIILGIDPGTNLLGYGIIRIDGKKMELLSIGVVRLSKLADHGEKLHHIFERISGLIDGYHATEVAIEAPFFGKNVQSMLKLGRAQGVAIAAAMVKGVPITEYAPKKIKQAVAGNGNAAKEQVAAMLETTLGISLENQLLDATDALATAVCHHYTSGSSIPGTGTKGKGWEAFINRHPERVKKTPL